MQVASGTYDLLQAMLENGNPNSITDAGVGVLCARTAVHGAHLNVKINAASLKNEEVKAKILKDALVVFEKSEARATDLLELIKL